MDLATLGLAALERLGREPAYYDGLEQRLGFQVRDGKALLIHCAGVSFPDDATGVNRQEYLKDAKPYCSFETSPPVKLEPEPTNKWDEFAVKVLIGNGVDEITSEWNYKHVGFIPKKRCPICCSSLSGKRAEKELCYECDAEVGVNSDFGRCGPDQPGLEIINRWIMDAFTQNMSVKAGVDNITVPQKTTGNMGLDIWVRIDEVAEGPDPTL